MAREIEKAGGVAKEFNTIAVDDGIAMGHGGMLYSLPSRDLIADSVEYMVNAHCADALVCISNCDKITPGMLMAALRLNIPVVFVSGGPMEAGKVNWQGEVLKLDLVDAMVAAADSKVSDAKAEAIERSACPTCGSCSGMFTANSMNCLTEALGLSLPGNGSALATHGARKELFLKAGRLIVEITKRHYEQDDYSVLPRSIANMKAFENAMSLDVAMGGSTNTVLHLLAAAHEAGVDFTMSDIDHISRKVPCVCKVAPATQKYHMEDVHHAGGVMGILGELDRAGVIHRDTPTVHSATTVSYTHLNCIHNGYRAIKFQGALRDCVPCEQRNRCLRNPDKTKARQVSFFQGKANATTENYTDKMKRRIDSAEGRIAYGRRFATVEPVFGNLRHNKQLNRFTLRGQKKVDAQWKLYCLVHNIEKLAHYGRMQ